MSDPEVQADQGNPEPIADRPAEGPPTASDLQERGIPSVNRVRSVQSRVTAALAVGFISLTSAGLLTWYYAHAFRRTEAEPRLRPKTIARAQTDVGLPPLGHFELPRVAPPGGPAAPPPDGSVIARWLGAAPPDPGNPPSLSGSIAPLPANPTRLAGVGKKKTSRSAPLDRRLGGGVLSNATASRSVSSASNEAASVPAAGSEGTTAPANPFVRFASEGASGAAESTAGRPSAEADVRGLLTAQIVPTVQARVLPTQRLLLPQGAFIDCTLETAIDSTLPGMTTCVTATDTFGTDGQVVLLERGTKLIGETRGHVQQGQSRIFVLWTQARTPTGVVIPLASPGTDELGRSGLPGEVDRHFLDRFGAALLITVIDGAVERAATPSSRGGIVTLNPSASESVLTEILRNTLNIPPTVRKDQGDRIQVLVARDVDFRSVYDLRLSTRAAQ